jgi:hypothetical protein
MYLQGTKICRGDRRIAQARDSNHAQLSSIVQQQPGRLGDNRHERRRSRHKLIFLVVAGRDRPLLKYVTNLNVGANLCVCPTRASAITRHSVQSCNNSRDDWEIAGTKVDLRAIGEITKSGFLCRANLCVCPTLATAITHNLVQSCNNSRDDWEIIDTKETCLLHN